MHWFYTRGFHLHELILGVHTVHMITFFHKVSAPLPGNTCTCEVSLNAWDQVYYTLYSYVTILCWLFINTIPMPLWSSLPKKQLKMSILTNFGALVLLQSKLCLSWAISMSKLLFINQSFGRIYWFVLYVPVDYFSFLLFILFRSGLEMSMFIFVFP